MMQVTLSEKAEARVRAEAGRRGVDASQLASTLIEHSLSEDSPDRIDPVDASVAFLRHRRQTEATTDPVELARRQQVTDELLLSLRRHAEEAE